VDGWENPIMTTKKRFIMIQRTLGAVQKYWALAGAAAGSAAAPRLCR
jgi:hypothetical protein